MKKMTLVVILISVVIIPKTSAAEVYNTSTDMLSNTSTYIDFEVSEPSSCYIEYGLDTNYGNYAYDGNYTAWWHYIEITDLTQATTYHYRINCIDYLGNQYSSGDYTFTTPSDADIQNWINSNRTSGTNQVYYLAPWGNDSNDGLSLTNPWRTFGHAIPLLDVGDTLYVVDGVYRENGTISFTNSGIPEAPIKVLAYNGTPILDSGDSTVSLGVGDNCYIIIDGVKLVSNATSGYTGITASSGGMSHHIFMYNLSIIANGSAGVEIAERQGSHHNVLYNSTIYNAGFNMIYLWGKSCDGPEYLPFEKILIRGNNLTKATRHNIINIAGNGRYLNIIDNIIVDTPSFSGIYGNVIYSRLNWSIYNNTIYNTKQAINLPGGSGIGICTKDSHSGYLYIGDNKIIDTKGDFAVYCALFNKTIFANNIVDYNRDSERPNYAYVVGYGGIWGADHVIIRNCTGGGLASDYKYGYYIRNRTSPITAEISDYFGYIDRNSYRAFINSGNFTISYTDGRVFKFGENYGTHYPIGSVLNATLSQRSGRVILYNMTVVPLYGVAKVSVSKINSTYVEFKVNASGSINFTIWSLKPNTIFSIKKNDVVWQITKSNSSGYITFTNSNWSDVGDIFTLEQTLNFGNITLNSCDMNGVEKNVFVEESIYVKGITFLAFSDIDVYIVNNTEWSDGKEIGPYWNKTTIQTDGNGEFLVLVWSNPIEGEYDIIADVNQNGRYDVSIDAIDVISAQPGVTAVVTSTQIIVNNLEFGSVLSNNSIYYYITSTFESSYVVENNTANNILYFAFIDFALDNGNVTVGIGANESLPTTAKLLIDDDEIPNSNVIDDINQIQITGVNGTATITYGGENGDNKISYFSDGYIYVFLSTGSASSGEINVDILLGVS